eukprot:1025546-Prymnesium_polylepis.1
MSCRFDASSSIACVSFISPPSALSTSPPCSRSACCSSSAVGGREPGRSVAKFAASSRAQILFVVPSRSAQPSAHTPSSRSRQPRSWHAIISALSSGMRAHSSGLTIRRSASCAEESSEARRRSNEGRTTRWLMSISICATLPLSAQLPISSTRVTLRPIAAVSSRIVSHSCSLIHSSRW